MYKILKKCVLNSVTKLIVLDAPLIAKKAEPGQFIILRINENGERIPLTISDFNRENGTITLIFQAVGKTTIMLGELKEGEFIKDVAGPLGIPTNLQGVNKAIVVAGGLGSAIAYPIAKKLHNLGTNVNIILGFRSQELIILEREMGEISNSLIILTDDGSNRNKGLVTDSLKKTLDKSHDLVITIGPLVMMKAVSNITKGYGIKTLVSMNPIMIDGTGMCGCCRVTVDGIVKFACVDGPDFDGHLIDFDEAIKRNHMYIEEEKKSCEDCKINR